MIATKNDSLNWHSWVRMIVWFKKNTFLDRLVIFKEKSPSSCYNFYSKNQARYENNVQIFILKNWTQWWPSSTLSKRKTQNIKKIKCWLSEASNTKAIIQNRVQRNSRWFFLILENFTRSCDFKLTR